MQQQTKANIKMEDESVKVKLTTKRQRSENWEEEKVLLKDLVRKKVGSIENKNTDTNSNQNKKKAWAELEKDFNILASEMRTVTQLKSQWTTLKIQAKKEVSKFRSESKKTGGGEAPASVQMSGNDIEVWLPNEFVTDDNEFDSDMTIAKCKQNCDANEFREIEFLSGEDVSQPPIDLGTPEKEVEETPKIKKKLFATQKKKKGQHKDQLDIECRRTLHQLQIEVEETKLRNMKQLHQLQIEVEEKKMRQMDDLHQIQVEKEKNKLRNIEAEYEVMQAKKKYFKNKAFDKTEL